MRSSDRSGSRTDQFRRIKDLRLVKMISKQPGGSKTNVRRVRLASWGWEPPITGSPVRVEPFLDFRRSHRRGGMPKDVSFAALHQWSQCVLAIPVKRSVGSRVISIWRRHSEPRAMLQALEIELQSPRWFGLEPRQQSPKQQKRANANHWLDPVPFSQHPEDRHSDATTT